MSSRNVIPKTAKIEKLSRIDRWCHTKVNVDHLFYVWQIEQFSLFAMDTRDCLNSSPFVVPGKEKIQWSIKVYPGGIDEDSKDHMSIFLIFLSNQAETVRASFQFSVLGKNSKKIKPVGFMPLHQFESGEDWGFKYFIHHDALFNAANGLLQNDRFTIYCEIAMISQPITANEEIIESTDMNQKSKYTLINDLDNLFREQLFTDITFNIGKKQLKAHRYVLAARSPAFDVMFTHSKGEKFPDIIEIKDIGSTVFEEVIKFIYTGRQPKSLKQFGIEFLKAAEKYKLPRLKVMCENTLSNSLTVEKAAETFVAADTYHAPTLRQHVLEYIDSHAEHVVKTDGYQHMLKHHSHLVTEILRAVAISCKRSVADILRHKQTMRRTNKRK